MKMLVPRIGFDRFIATEWATIALSIRAGLSQPNDLEDLLDAAGLGAAARTKTRTVLKRLWLEPRSDLVDFADRGAALFKARPATPPFVMHWGMAIAAYPFFGKVAELIGRLTALHGDCASSELHRRMSEIFGEREGTYRMTNMVVQSQAHWGAVRRIEKGTRIIRTTPCKLEDDDLIIWLLEACLRLYGRPIPVASLGSQSVLYPFDLTRPLSFIISNSERMAIRTEGPNNQIASLREAIS